VLEVLEIVTGIVLTGGKSKRLNRDKAFVKLEGISIIKRVISSLSNIVNELIIVTNEEKKDVYSSFGTNIKVVTDIFPERAALGGLYTGLSYSNNNYSIVVACDMPFLNSSLLQYMVNLSPGYDAVIPRIGNYLEPLHAVYSKKCVTTAENLINQNDLSIRKLIGFLRVRYVLKKEIMIYDPEIESFFNINNNFDLEKAEKIVEKHNKIKGS
jgi:molybdopterin-guanine dinucleotide biosynthesis protein A